jgi:Superinfection immunity protein
MFTLLTLFLIFYLVPSFIASMRGHRNAGAIFILNLLAGWTFVGWIVAMVWAFTADVTPTKRWKIFWAAASLVCVTAIPVFIAGYVAYSDRLKESRQPIEQQSAAPTPYASNQQEIPSPTPIPAAETPAVPEGTPYVQQLVLRNGHYVDAIPATTPVPETIWTKEELQAYFHPAAQAQDDKSFFAGTHLGMTIEQCGAFYHGFGIYAVGHSGSPQGEAQVDFRTSAVPQRRVYVFYRKSTGKIVSVMYWKLGENETFSKDEIQFLTSLNQGGGLVTQVSDGGSEFEVSTPRQFQLEQAQADPMIKNHD